MWPFKKKELVKSGQNDMPPVKPLRKARVWKPAAVKINAGKRFFESAMTGRLQASWTTQPISSDQLIATNLRQLRARSREQTYNNDYAKRFISMIKCNVVGSNGIIVQSQATGRTGEPDRMARESIEKAFNDWARAKNCDVRGRLSWRELQSVSIANVSIDGELLIRRHKKGKYGFQIELVDPEFLDIDHNEILPSGNEIRFSIEFDASYRVVAYHIMQPENVPYSYLATYNNKHYVRVPADEIIHLFVTDYIDQKRGLPWMSTALSRMKTLSSFEDAALTAARAGASKMGFFESEQSDQYMGETDDEGNVIEDFTPGYMQQLPPGMKFTGFDPGYPNGEFESFMKSCLRGIASGLSVSYATLGNDLSETNFSSMRHGAVEEREIWKQIQAWLIENLIQPVFEEWLELQLTLGTINVPVKGGGTKALNRALENYLPALYQPRRWSWVDPIKDIQSKKMEIELGISSISSVIREQGKDPAEVWKEIETERAIMDELGISITMNEAKDGPADKTESNGDSETDKSTGKDKK